MKIGLITSKGGHLFQLYQLQKCWSKYNRFWVTDKGEDVNYLLSNERVYYGFFPESRNVQNFILNLFLSFKIIIKEKPDVLVSTGAGIAVPFFYFAKFLKIKLIFIEPYDFIAYPSLTSKLIHPIVSHYLVQHRSQKSFFKDAKLIGPLL